MQIPWGAIITLLVYIVGSTIGFVWWMATITEQLKNLGVAVTNLSNNNILYARKEDIARELGVIEKRQETMWEKLDKLKEKVDGSNGVRISKANGG